MIGLGVGAGAFGNLKLSHFSWQKTKDPICPTICDLEPFGQLVEGLLLRGRGAPTDLVMKVDHDVEPHGARLHRILKDEEPSVGKQLLVERSQLP
jgi:hypothetical protein